MTGEGLCAGGSSLGEGRACKREQVLCFGLETDLSGFQVCGTQLSWECTKWRAGRLLCCEHGSGVGTVAGDSPSAGGGPGPPQVHAHPGAQSPPWKREATPSRHPDTEGREHTLRLRVGLVPRGGSSAVLPPPSTFPHRCPIMPLGQWACEPLPS